MVNNKIQYIININAKYFNNILILIFYFNIYLFMLLRYKYNFNFLLMNE